MAEVRYERTPPGGFPSFSAAREELEKALPGTYDTPWWGTKATSGIRGLGGPIVNRGFVIGYRDDAKRQRWRLDWDRNDPEKGLHINYEQDVEGREKTAIHFPCRSGYVVPGDEMWFWYWRWTTRHANECPANVMRLMGGDQIWYGAYWGPRR